MNALKERINSPRHLPLILNDELACRSTMTGMKEFVEMEDCHEHARPEGRRPEPGLTGNPRQPAVVRDRSCGRPAVHGVCRSDFDEWRQQRKRVGAERGADPPTPSATNTRDRTALED